MVLCTCQNQSKQQRSNNARVAAAFEKVKGVFDPRGGVDVWDSFSETSFRYQGLGQCA